MSNSKLHLRPNVIDGPELQELFEAVFGDMATYVSRAYGPYGGNTCYQLRDKILMTKDGWTVEQEFTYSKNLLANIVRKLIIKVSNAIYLHAGDGTSTGLLVAQQINKELLNYKNKHKIHSKTLTTAIEQCVYQICKELTHMATQVTADNMEEIIHQIALVSLDWNTQLAEFIKTIYKKTGNPFIHIRESGCTTSFVDYINGYDLSGRLITDFRINDIENRRFKINRPSIMVFSHSLQKELFTGLLAYCTNVATIMPGLGEFVIMAPGFDKGFRDNYAAICTKCIQTNRPMIPMTLVQYDTPYNIDREMVDDFCMLVGASLITSDMLDYENALRGCEVLLHMSAQADAKPEDLVKISQDMLAKVESFDVAIGCCEEFWVDNKTIVASGLGDNENCDEIKKRIRLLEVEIEKKRGDFDAKSMYADDIRIKTARLSKLKLKSGIIRVGGFGEDNIKSTKDALDDAIKACTTAYTDGVVVGGNIAPIIAIDNLLSKLNKNETLIHAILMIIRDGYVETTKIMYNNKYGTVDVFNAPLVGEQLEDFLKVFPHGEYVKESASEYSITTDDLVEYCVSSKCAWNLITDKLDATIIHPVVTEIEIIKGILQLVLTTVTTNQLFYHGYEGIDQELEEMREVPVDGVPENPVKKFK